MKSVFYHVPARIAGTRQSQRLPLRLFWKPLENSSIRMGESIFVVTAEIQTASFIPHRRCAASISLGDLDLSLLPLLSSAQYDPPNLQCGILQILKQYHIAFSSLPSCRDPLRPRVNPSRKPTSTLSARVPSTVPTFPVVNACATPSSRASLALRLNDKQSAAVKKSSSTHTHDRVAFPNLLSIATTEEVIKTILPVLVKVHATHAAESCIDGKVIAIWITVAERSLALAVHHAVTVPEVGRTDVVAVGGDPFASKMNLVRQV